MVEIEGYTGKIYVYEINNVKIHTYVGYTGDASSIIETDESLILLDAQPVHSSSAELKKYLTTLNKPLKQVLIPSHPLGLAYYEGTPVNASEQIISFVDNGGAQIFVDIFTGAFGADMDNRIVRINSSINEGENTIDGVKFIMDSHKEEFPPVSDLEFTEYNILFTHLAAYDAHMLVSNRGQIDELRDYWTNVQTKNYKLILSSHLAPVDSNATDFQLKYLEVLEEAAKNETKEGFIETMQKQYPNATRQQFLFMTADNFYKQ